MTETSISDADSTRHRAFSRQLILATAGHVDHGKTSVVRHLTGVDTDTLAEERARGLTINPGYAYYHFTNPQSTDGIITLGFVDVPGHADFIPNMLAGVGNVEHALLVVACDDGVMPQTVEHLDILQLLGVNEVIVVLSKTDRADSERILQTRQEVDNLLSRDGFAPPHYFEVSNLSAGGIPELKQFLQDKALNSASSSLLGQDHHTRFVIDRSFSVKGIGTVVTGTLKHGQLPSSEPLVLSSTGEAVRVRGLRVDQQDIESLMPGQRAAININVSLDQVKKGDWLLGKASHRPCYRVDVELRLLEGIQPLKSSAQYHLYHGAAHHVVNLRALDCQLGLYQVRSLIPLQVHHGDRFVLRDPGASNTLGGGQIIDIFVPRKGRANEMRLTELQCKQHPAAEAFERLLRVSPLGFDITKFAVNFNLNTVAMRRLTDEVRDTSTILTLRGIDSSRILSSATLEILNQHILEAIASFHRDSPSVTGISGPELNKATDFQGSPLLLGAILEELVKRGLLKRTGTLLHLPDHQASLGEEEEKFLARIHPILKHAGRIPPRTRELVEITNIPLGQLERILRQSSKSGLVTRVAANRHFLPETLAELAELSEELAQAGDNEDGFTVIQFRDASGIGRNLCIEILEYFDSIGFTRREDNARFIRTQKENLFVK
ncbi:MAG: selenocysteine-specific translation elongation factor [Gammaproteobacteria bacterium]|nr:selenocysteine-specific translation elongation factor [Gammaproteobacteria bacterium]